MHNSNWKYEYEVEHERLVKAHAEIKKLKDALEHIIKWANDSPLIFSDKHLDTINMVAQEALKDGE